MSVAAMKTMAIRRQGIMGVLCRRFVKREKTEAASLAERRHGRCTGAKRRAGSVTPSVRGDPRYQAETADGTRPRGRQGDGGWVCGGTQPCGFRKEAMQSHDEDL